MKIKSNAFWIIFLIVFLVFTFIEPKISALMFGSLMFYNSIIALRFLKKIKENGISCNGKVKSDYYDSDGFKTPIVDYFLQDGTFHSGKPYYHTSFEITGLKLNKSLDDKEIQIAYLPTEPQKFILSNQLNINFVGCLFFLLIGIGIIIVSVNVILGFINFD